MVGWYLNQMAIDDLQAIMPPPARTPDAVVPWSTIEQGLGTALPTDYKLFVERYGAGYISRFMSVFVPLAANPNVDLIVQRDRQLGALRELRDLGEDFPLPIFPEPGGVLPFGLTDNGDVLHWITSGEPDGWQIAINAARSPETDVYPGSMTRLLVDLFAGRWIGTVFPKGRSTPYSRPTARVSGHRRPLTTHDRPSAFDPLRTYP